MLTFDSWLDSRGPVLALALEDRRERICDFVSSHFAEQFSTLMLDTNRPDAASFQQNAFYESPRRFHRLLQVALRLQAIMVIEREYRWSWGILPRFGVTQRHMVALVRLYFEAARKFISLDGVDRSYVDELEETVLQTIARSAPVEYLRIHQPQHPGYTNGHANGHSNGHLSN
jgi:hypothetical protein